MSNIVEKPIVQFVSWRPMGTWKFNTGGDECTICKSPFVESCILCAQSSSSVEMVCKVSRGKCGHAFHKHCIDKFLSSSKAMICPICATPYSTEIEDMGNNEDWKKAQRVK